MNVTTQGIGHKVMSVLMALVLAIGLAPMVPAGNAWAAESDNDNDPANALAVWQGHKFNYNVEQNKDKEYVVTSGEQFAVESVIDPATQTALDSDEYTVVYFEDNDGTDGVSDGDTIVDSSKAISGKVGTMPEDAGEYFIAVMKTDSIPSDYVPVNGLTWKQWSVDFMNGKTLLWKAQVFTVEPALVSVEGAGAFVYNATDTDNVLDTDFMYIGTAQQFGIEVDGEQLMDGEFTYTWENWPNKAVDPKNEPQWNTSTSTFNFTKAGTYTLSISGTAAEGYTGTEQVSFEVAPLDLTNDAIAAKVYYRTGINANIADMTGFTVNGKEITDVSRLSGEIKIDPHHYVDAKGQSTNDFKNMNAAGAYTYQLSVVDPKGTDVVGGPRDVTVYTTTNAVTFSYDGVAIEDTADGKTLNGKIFNQAKDEAFDVELLKAAYTDAEGTHAVDYKLTVTKDGEPVTTYTEPGKYELTVESLDTQGYVYGGIDHATFYVVRDVLESPVAYMTLDGKYVTDDNNKFTYTQSVMTPVVTVKDGDKVLTAGEDFTVAYTKDGEPVDEILNVGEYKAVISLDGYIVNTPGADELTIDFEVTKAVIDRVEAVTESYGAIALPSDGSAATVSFVGYAAGSNVAYTLAPEDLWVIYFAYNADKTKKSEVEADELNAAGKYSADVTILDTCANLEGGDKVVDFTLTDAVSYVDVSVDAWYADEVYKATDNGYVKGMGNKLFFPEAQMTRAQFAQVLYNMAGEPAWAPDTYPTQFTDVTADAWYAKAVSWAVEAGIVKGKSETTFDPEGNITREEIATMLYRYAGNGAEADASALDAFVDGDQVCDWAETAVAWAVENGYMQGKGANDLQPHATATRAEVAALSVRVQPEELEKPLV